jgi:excisionase family DNA binding protein
MPRDYTTGEIARALQVAPRTVAHWIDDGLLQGYQLPGSRHRRVQGEQLAKFVKDNHLPAELLELREHRV